MSATRRDATRRDGTRVSWRSARTPEKCCSARVVSSGPTHVRVERCNLETTARVKSAFVREVKFVDRIQESNWNLRSATKISIYSILTH